MQKTIAAMEKKEIEYLIRKYLRDNHSQHPQAFPETLPEITFQAKMLALSYWDHRTRREIKRDWKASVTEEDYINWCFDELTALKKVVLYN